MSNIDKLNLNGTVYDLASLGITSDNLELTTIIQEILEKLKDILSEELIRVLILEYLSETGEGSEIENVWIYSETVSTKPSSKKIPPSSAWITEFPENPQSYVYMCQGFKYKDTDTVKYTSIIGDWTGPIRLSSSIGSSGVDASDRDYVYTRTETDTAPLKPSFLPPITASLITDTSGVIWYNHAQGINKALRYEWVSEATKPSGNNTYWESYGEPVLWSAYGEKGLDGDGVIYIFKRTIEYEAPELGFDEQSTPESLAYKEAGWTDDPKGIDADIQYEWVSVYKEISGVKKWSTPTLWNKWANDGKAGRDGIAVEYIYKRTKRFTTGQNDDYLQLKEEVQSFDTSSDEFQVDDFVPNTWTDNPQGVTLNPEEVLEWTSYREKYQEEGTSDYKWGLFSSPVIWSAYGEDGRDGDGIEYAYLAIDSLLTEDQLNYCNPTPGYITSDGEVDNEQPWLTNAEFLSNDDYMSYIKDNPFIGYDGITYNWTDDPLEDYDGTNAFLYMTMRKQVDGVWQAFRIPKLWTVYSLDNNINIDCDNLNVNLSTDAGGYVSKALLENATFGHIYVRYNGELIDLTKLYDELNYFILVSFSAATLEENPDLEHVTIKVTPETSRSEFNLTLEDTYDLIQLNSEVILALLTLICGGKLVTSVILNIYPKAGNDTYLVYSVPNVINMGFAIASNLTVYAYKYNSDGTRVNSFSANYLLMDSSKFTGNSVNFSDVLIGPNELAAGINGSDEINGSTLFDAINENGTSIRNVELVLIQTPQTDDTAYKVLDHDTLPIIYYKELSDNISLAAYTVNLSNDSACIAKGSSSETVKALTSCDIQVYSGVNYYPITADEVEFTTEFDSDLIKKTRGESSDVAFYIDCDADLLKSSVITIKITLDNGTVLTKNMTLTIVESLVAASYKLNTTPASIIIDPNDTESSGYKPSVINASVTKYEADKVTNGTPDSYNLSLLVYTSDNTWENVIANNNNDSVNILIEANIISEDNVKIRIIDLDNFIWDSETIPIIASGLNGTDGKDGTDGNDGTDGSNATGYIIDCAEVITQADVDSNSFPCTYWSYDGATRTLLTLGNDNLLVEGTTGVLVTYLVGTAASWGVIATASSDTIKFTKNLAGYRNLLTGDTLTITLYRVIGSLSKTLITKTVKAVVDGTNGEKGEDAIQYEIQCDDIIRQSDINGTFVVKYYKLQGPTRTEISDNVSDGLQEEVPYYISLESVGVTVDHSDPTALTFSDLTLTEGNYFTISLYNAEGTLLIAKKVKALIERAGLTGLSFLYNGPFVLGTTYRNGYESDNYNRIVDVVSYVENNEVKYAYPNETYSDVNATPDDNSEWTSAPYLQFIASGLILAENATINLLNSQEIHLLDAEGNVTAGISGVNTLDSDGDDVQSADLRFWAGSGGSNFTDSPFQVYEDGTLIATKASMDNLQANNVVINGELNVKAPTLRSGSLIAPGYYEASTYDTKKIPNLYYSGFKFDVGSIIRIYHNSGITTLPILGPTSFDSSRNLWKCEISQEADGVTLEYENTGGTIYGPLFIFLDYNGDISASNVMPSGIVFCGGYVELTCIRIEESTGNVDWMIDCSHASYMLDYKKVTTDSNATTYTTEVYYILGNAVAYYHSRL